MAFSGLSKKFTEFESTTSASDSDVILKSDSSGLVKKVSISSLANILKSKIIGTTSMGTTASTVTGAIAELKGLIGTGGGSGLPSDFLSVKTLYMKASNMVIPKKATNSSTYRLISTEVELPPGKYLVVSATGFIQNLYNGNFILRLEGDAFVNDESTYDLNTPVDDRATGKNTGIVSSGRMLLSDIFEVTGTTNNIARVYIENWSTSGYTLQSNIDHGYYYWKFIKLK